MQTWNFSAGPATLPRPVIRQAQEELLDYRGTGVSIIEISHRSPEFLEVMDTATTLFRKVTGVPEEYHLLFVHGGARMQFSAVPLNLIGRSKARLCCYVETGLFARQAREEAARYGEAMVIASSAASGFDRIPDIAPDAWPEGAAYLHLTTNNTAYGTRWNTLPEGFPAPLVADATSDLLSRRTDLSRFGITYAGFQKNLGPSSLALVIVREDLLGHALPETPLLLDYRTYADSGSLHNTPNTFAIYVMSLMMRWIEEQGGLAAVEATNETKATLLYRELDRTGFWVPRARPEHRSATSVTFAASGSLSSAFLKESMDHRLLGLQGHRTVGGLRACLYNGMPIEGVAALVELMRDFESRRG